MPAFGYPRAERSDTAEVLHGVTVADPYRWLEDTYAPETEAWVKAENELTESYLESIACREELQARLTALRDYPKFGVPFERGGKWFQTRDSGLQNQPVLYVTEGPDGEGHVLLDPNLLSEDGTVAMTGANISVDGKLLAYATSDAGSDWKTWHVRGVEDGTDRPDRIDWSKFSSASWRRDGSGFYYNGVDQPASGGELLEETRRPRLYFHRLGEDQSEDTLVFSTPEEPEWLFEAEVTDDDRYLILSIVKGTSVSNQLRVLDLTDEEAGFLEVVTEFESEARFVTNMGSTLVLLTDYGADRRRLVQVDINGPDRESWVEVVPESEDTLLEAYHYGGKLVCHYLRDAHSRLSVHALSGEHLWDVPIPPMVSLAAVDDGKCVTGRSDSGLTHFQVVSFTDSGSLWSHDLETADTRMIRGPAADIDPTGFVTEQVMTRSSDGTLVPMFLTRRKDISPTGEVPVLLYGYGGFDIPVTPGFGISFAAWVERGGLLAVANLRGGGEYGKAWHEAGRLANKQNVFDDFCACASWLGGESGWSTPSRIAINGGSNGGLLVGACLTQHPELFGAAVPQVGVLDMLRFHKFTIGWAWKSDYGDPDNPTDYGWLRAYSPLHNIRGGLAYPPTLIMTGDHDDRVVPGHSFKFAATLQAAQGAPAPILIRVETSAGHGMGKPTSKLIDESADMLAFLEHTMSQSS